jgi:hypothetical protein
MEEPVERVATKLTIIKIPISELIGPIEKTKKRLEEIEKVAYRDPTDLVINEDEDVIAAFVVTVKPKSEIEAELEKERAQDERRKIKKEREAKARKASNEEARKRSLEAYKKLDEKQRALLFPYGPPK